MNAELAALAEALAGGAVRRIERVPAGGNNELFRVEAASSTFALKRYPAPELDPRDRLGREFEALQFLRDAGERCVPRAIAADRARRVALYEWIDGERPQRFDDADIAASMRFLARVHAARRNDGASALADAVEACFDGATLRRQIEERLVRLRSLPGEPELHAFLDGPFAAQWNAVAEPLAAIGPLPRERQTLSPSDFGRHNTLRRADASLVFVDFEYFGWDDPVKLVADTLWHPGSDLDTGGTAAVRAAALEIYGTDPAFAARLHALEIPYGLRWTLIVLAEFLPDRWERRRAAGMPGAWEAAKARQLARAQALLARCMKRVG